MGRKKLSVGDVTLPTPVGTITLVFGTPGMEVQFACDANQILTRHLIPWKTLVTFFRVFRSAAGSDTPEDQEPGESKAS